MVHLSHKKVIKNNDVFFESKTALTEETNQSTFEL